MIDVAFDKKIILTIIIIIRCVPTNKQINGLVDFQVGSIQMSRQNKLHHNTLCTDAKIK
jgi:hypothetical protein